VSFRQHSALFPNKSLSLSLSLSHSLGSTRQQVVTRIDLHSKIHRPTARTRLRHAHVHRQAYMCTDKHTCAQTSIPIEAQGQCVSCVMGV